MLVREAAALINSKPLTFGDPDMIQASRILTLAAQAEYHWSKLITIPQHLRERINQLQNWDEVQLRAFLYRKPAPRITIRPTD
jgi:hypothetical protein